MGFLYFLPLAFGALRASEPHHLFLSDVGFDFEFGSGALLSLWHPVRGPAPGEPGKWRNREEYLAGEFKLQPRNVLTGHRHAGWKNLLLEETVPGMGQRSRVYWVIPEIGRLFWRFHEAYVRIARPRGGAHPYYFASSWGNAFGNPWTLDSSQCLFRRAIARLGLEPGSARGLCQHAFRHRIVHWLIVRGVPPEARRIILHHQSIESQSDYGKLPNLDVSAILQSASDVSFARPRVDQEPFAPSPPLWERFSRFEDIGRELVEMFLGDAP